MKVLKVIPGHDFPLDAVTQKFAWLGRTSSGKTFACKRFVEQMLKVTAQVLVVDSVGVWHGLRQGDRGFDIPVLGGLYGDIPLEPTAGALVAEVAVSSGSSLVLDVSQMNDAQRARFMEALGRRLFELKKANPGAMHIVLDEGQDTVPQNPQPNESMMLHEWVRICKQGRAFGMGVSIVSQRPQEISKKALNQVECVLAFQITGAHERKALEYWLSDKGIDTKLAQTLPALEVGTPFLWSPQWLKVAAVTGRVLPIESADTSQTPKVGDAPRARAAMKPIDLGELRQSMAEMVEKVKESDPMALKKRIKELEAQLESDGLTQDTERQLDELLEKINERDKRDQEMSAGLSDAETAAHDMSEALDSLATSARTLAIMLGRCKQAPLGVPQPRRKPKPEAIRPRLSTAQGEKASAAREGRLSDNGQVSELPTGEAAILKAAFEYGDRGISMAALAVITGYKRRSVQAYVQRLVTQDMLERITPGRVLISALGKKAVPGGARPDPRGKALVTHLVNTLPEGEAKILGLVSAEKNKQMRVQDLQPATGYAQRSVQAYVQRLVTRQILARAGAGQVKLHPEVLS
jgi:hypothetical protein